MQELESYLNDFDELTLGLDIQQIERLVSALQNYDTAMKYFLESYKVILEEKRTGPAVGRLLALLKACKEDGEQAAEKKLVHRMLCFDLSEIIGIIKNTKAEGYPRAWQLFEVQHIISDSQRSIVDNCLRVLAKRGQPFKTLFEYLIPDSVKNKFCAERNLLTCGNLAELEAKSNFSSKQKEIFLHFIKTENIYNHNMKNFRELFSRLELNAEQEKVFGKIFRFYVAKNVELPAKVMKQFDTPKRKPEDGSDSTPEYVPSTETAEGPPCKKKPAAKVVGDSLSTALNVAQQYTSPQMPAENQRDILIARILRNRELLKQQFEKEVAENNALSVESVSTQVSNI